VTQQFASLDWAVVGFYVIILFVGGIYFTPRKTTDAKDYFLASGQIPAWLAAISVLAAAQSAATFLGAPDSGYRGDYTYLSSNVGALAAAAFVATILIPRYYTLGVTTVYELLDIRFGKIAMRAAGGMFLIGRVLAGGSRVYLGAIAVSMIMFSNVSAQGIIVASLAIVIASFAFTFLGGLKSVIWNDLIQFAIYICSAIAILIFLWSSIPSSNSEILVSLANTPDGKDKLRLFNFSLSLTEPFSMPAIMTGVFLLMVGNFGMDQDTTQRLLACKDAKAGGRSLYMSVLAGIPIIFVFITIGVLLHIFYDRPDLMHSTTSAAAKKFQGQDITIFMHFILTELPPGLRGLATIGIISAAVATTNSALNAMSSVVIEDFYRPWRLKRHQVSEQHFVSAGRIGMAVMGVLMFIMAVLSYYWQKYANMPLLDFVLSIMTFAYAGLLGVYFTAIFTTRGSNTSVVLSLATGFIAILIMQKYFVDLLGLPEVFKSLAFPWQLCLATALSFTICVMGNKSKSFQNSSPVLTHGN
jgi:solute:Na+ symporter, SSS family